MQNFLGVLFLMSRSGRIPITIPENTEVKVDGGVFLQRVN